MCKEMIGLDLEFEEIKQRGSDSIRCVLRATEEGRGGCYVEETIESSSWEKFKKEFPTLKDVLIDLFPTISWNPTWRDGDRILYLKSVCGHTGLYEFNENDKIEVDWDELK